MGSLLRVALALIVGLTLGQKGPRPAPTVAHGIMPRNPPEEAEQIFAYGVLSDAAKRSLDAVRFVDALLLGVIAAQTAILAIYVDRAHVGDAALWGGFTHGLVRSMDIGLMLSCIGLVLTLLAVDEGPDADEFLDDFPDDPRATRAAVMEGFRYAVDRNDLVRGVKTVILVIAILVTVWDVLSATDFFNAGFWTT